MWLKTASFLKRWCTNAGSQPSRRLILDGDDYYLWVLSIQLASCDHPDSYIRVFTTVLSTSIVTKPQSVLRQVHTLYLSEFSTERNPVLPLSTSSILKLP